MVGAGAVGVLYGDDVLGLGDVLGLRAGIYAGADLDMLGAAVVADDDDADEAGA